MRLMSAKARAPYEGDSVATTTFIGVPTIGLRGNIGRHAQSMAFFTTLGRAKLYSGDVQKTPSACAIAARRALTDAGVCSARRSALNIGTSMRSNRDAS